MAIPEDDYVADKLYYIVNIDANGTLYTEAASFMVTTDGHPINQDAKTELFAAAMDVAMAAFVIHIETNDSPVTVDVSRRYQGLHIAAL